MNKTCYREVGVIIDIKIEAEIPNLFQFEHNLTQEEKAKRMEAWVKDFQAFIRDHRSQDPVFLHVVRDKADLCSSCGHTWEADKDALTGKSCCAWCGAEIVE